MQTYTIQGKAISLPAAGDTLKIAAIRDSYQSKAGRFGISAYAIDAQGAIYSISASKLSDSERAKLLGSPAPAPAPTKIEPASGISIEAFTF